AAPALEALVALAGLAAVAAVQALSAPAAVLAVADSAEAPAAGRMEAAAQVSAVEFLITAALCQSPTAPFQETQPRAVAARDKDLVAAFSIGTGPRRSI